MAEINGSCDSAFDSVRDLLQHKLAEGQELGASLCVNIDGKNVLDLWGGYADPSQTKPWEKDTITGIWSATKIITTLACHILAERGQLDPSEKVATYWPEFAANGKENITVSHILSHSSGLPAWDTPISPEEIQDVEKSTQRLAEEAPWFAPGSQIGYQFITFGHLLSELIRRTTGKSATEFITEEIIVPLGADFQIGVSEDKWSRIAETIPFPLHTVPKPDPDLTSYRNRALMGSCMIPTLPNQPGFRKSENWAASGFSNARALARIGSMVSLDGLVDGKQYLTPQSLDKMMIEQIRGRDEAVDLEFRLCLGLGLPFKSLPPVPDENGICFWGGWGGSMLVMDRGRRMTIGYVMNQMEFRMLGTSSFDAYVQEIYKAFDLSKSR